MKIVLAEKVSPATIAVFASEPGWQVVPHDQIRNGLAAEVADADALIVRSAVQVDAALLGAAPKLRVIGRAGVGVDNIDADTATRRGIVVMNTPGANAVAVAELVLSLMVDLARMVPRANSTMHEGKWEKKSLQGTELRGKTLGIIGLGRVGMEVARRARAFGMDLIGHDPFVSAAIARENGVRLAPAEEVMRSADYLTLHVGLTPQTEGMINAKTLDSMKKGVRIINCARGELVDEAALVAALRSGHVAGAALDVFQHEPLKDSPLMAMDNVILTPHIAGSTAEAQESVGVQIAEQIKAYLKQGVVQNAVNAASLTYEEYAEIAPYVGMAENLGSMLTQIATGSVESIQIVYTGRLAAMRTELMRNAALCGVLANHEHVNRINSASVATECGIRVHEVKEEAVTGGATNVLKLTLHTANGDLTATATVLPDGSPRLLAIGGIHVEAPLEGTLIISRSKDVPGVVGRIGTILGEHGVNIANFGLGRSTAAQADTPGDAMAVIQIDEHYKSAEVARALEELRAFRSIVRAGLVKLK